MEKNRTLIYFFLIALLIIATGFVQSWNTALIILNMGMISAIMALGLNLQWGFAGLFNVGIMGFIALGGLATVLVSADPVKEAWAAGGAGMIAALLIGALVILAAVMTYRKMQASHKRNLVLALILVAGFFLYRYFYDPAATAIEAINPTQTGYLGGLGLPVILAWPVGGLLAAGAAWLIGKTALGLRSDYLAIATLGIAEIIVTIMKNEDWLDRGVKNVVGLDRPVPQEIDLQQSTSFLDWTSAWHLDPSLTSSVIVKLCYFGLFSVVLIVLMVMAQASVRSPWGRMMRAIRDNETAALAMGKNVTKRHLQIFILGSAICGIAGAMMTTMDGQLTPPTYQPLRYTFLIWVMVIVGGSGNNWGAVLGGFLIWWLWVEVEPLGRFLMDIITSPLPADNALRNHLLDSVAYMRLFTMGLVLLLVLRFSPRGLLPEK